MRCKSLPPPGGKTSRCVQPTRCRLPAWPASKLWRFSMDINLPEVLAEVRHHSELYEKALVNNDVDMLDSLF